MFLSGQGKKKKHKFKNVNSKEVDVTTGKEKIINNF